MTYELAKELKDAGFPQKGDWKDPYHQYWSTYDGAASKTAPQLIWGDEANFGFMEDLYFVPTLDELIEACGERFEGLERISDKWGAYCDTDERPENSIGSTPTEAVARLWLALNKK